MVLSAVIMFFLRQLAKWGDTLKPELLKQDAHARLAPMLPDGFIESVALALVDKAIDVLCAVVVDTADIKKIVDLVVAKDIAGALIALKDLILGVAIPTKLHHALAAACNHCRADLAAQDLLAA